MCWLSYQDKEFAASLLGAARVEIESDINACTKSCSDGDQPKRWSTWSITPCSNYFCFPKCNEVPTKSCCWDYFVLPYLVPSPPHQPILGLSYSAVWLQIPWWKPTSRLCLFLSKATCQNKVTGNKWREKSGALMQWWTPDRQHGRCRICHASIDALFKTCGCKYMMSITLWLGYQLFWMWYFWGHKVYP